MTRVHRTFVGILYATACLLTLTATAAPSPVAAALVTPTQVLFVGNSLTYVGNLPAVFTALSTENGHPVHADMLVKGGATLTQWLDRGAVKRALAAKHYSDVVLQERGGDFACDFGPQTCKDSQHALRKLAQLIGTHGAKPILLGTYQVSAKASHELVAAEAKAAHANNLPYVDVSNRLNAGRSQYPFFAWFAKEGHPGPDLVLLEATLLYHQLYGTLPTDKPLRVRAPLFIPASKFAPPDPVSLPLLPAIPLAGGYDYAPMETAAALKLAAEH